MNPSLDRLKGIRARETKSVLHALSELAKRAQTASKGEAPPLPRVRIDTSTGLGYEGWVHGVEQRTASCSVLLEHDLSRPSGGGMVLSFLELVEPYHITFLDAGDFLGFFRFGEVPRLSQDGPMSSLQLKRFVEAKKGELAAGTVALEVADALIAEGGLGNNVVRDVIEALREYVDKTRKEPAGAAALKTVEKLSLRLARGTRVRPARKGAEVAIELDPQEGFEDKGALFASLDQIL